MPTYFVATNGSDTNPGTQNSPWSLAWARSSSNTVLQPGDVVVLQDGVYTSASSLAWTKAGTAAAPILYRARQEGAVTIDAPVSMTAADIWFQGIGFAYLTPEARFHPTTHTSLTRSLYGVNANGLRQRYIQCRLHNNINGMFSGVQGGGVHVDECYVYNNGVEDPVRKYGHGLYLQNQVANGRKQVRNNIAFGNFFAGQQWFGTNADVTGITARENAGFLHEQPDILCYSQDGDCGDIVLAANSFRSMPRATPAAVRFDARDTLIERNILEGSLLLNVGDRYSAFDNTITWRSATGGTSPLFFSYLRNGQLRSDHTYDRNHLFRWSSGQSPFYGPDNNTQAQWQSFGYEANGTVTIGAPTDRHFVWPSRYTDGRAHLHVWNWSGASSHLVDLGPMQMAFGTPFAIYHVFDFVANGSPLVQGTYTGQRITVPMDARQPPTPLGGATPAMMDNTFGAFVVTTRPGYTPILAGGLG
jgi:hypothetical protein